MKYKPEFSFTLTDEELTAESEKACTVGKVKLGEQVALFSRFAGGSYMPYSEMVNAYVRQEEVNAKLCCGRANFDQFFLMLLGSDGVLRKHQVNTKEDALAALDIIALRNPDTQIGYRKPATAG